MKAKRLFTVFVPDEKKRKMNIQEIITKFQQKLVSLRWIMLLTSVIFLLPIPMLYKIIYLVLTAFLPMYLLYKEANKARQSILRIKKEELWEISSEKVVHIDLGLNEQITEAMLPMGYFLIPILMQFLALSYDEWKGQGLSVLSISSIFLLGMGVLGYFLLRRLPNKTYCDDHDKNRNVNEMQRYYYSLFLFYVVLMDAFIMLAVRVFEYATPKMLTFVWLGFIIVLTFLVFLAINSVSKYRNYKNNMLQSTTQYDNQAETYWKYTLLGSIYRNPYDTRLFIDSNNGMTINMARPGAKIFFGAIFGGVFLLLSYYFIYPAWLDHNHKLVELSVNQEVVEVYGPMYSNQISIESIQNVDLITKLPHGTRTWGTGTFTYMTGNFKLDTYGKCRMYVASKHKAYVVITTDKGIVIVNDDEIAKTKAVYTQLKHMLELQK
ncbi:hypothetical protein bsdtb5_16570 [Anaeromicropila herbilytica]|uniref:Bacterial Pleckstrin homology domain-containing protein n=2 Tax=Anaeromicropila herbilytica TaxID=2785025 RepID=A0A7R7EKX9_9FIRM|nr:hypothetical protein bsdtb5_16570 [Anaeromicropila herbilytica]